MLIYVLKSQDQFIFFVFPPNLYVYSLGLMIYSCTILVQGLFVLLQWHKLLGQKNKKKRKKEMDNGLSRNVWKMARSCELCDT